MGNFQDLKQTAYDNNMRLPALGLVLYAFGNASVVDRKKKVFVIKPSGVDYEKLRPEDMVIVDFNGRVIEGDYERETLEKTVYNSAVLEEIARMALLTVQIKPDAARLTPSLIKTS